MATFDSTEYANFNASPRVMNPVSSWGGRVRARTSTSPGATGLAQDDFVRLFPIYKGERPLFFAIINATNTASLTCDVGLEGGTENKYVSAQAIATAAAALVCSLVTAAETADGVVTLKFEAANPSDTADVEVTMFYVVD